MANENCLKKFVGGRHIVPAQQVQRKRELIPRGGAKTASIIYNMEQFEVVPGYKILCLLASKAKEVLTDFSRL